MYGNWRLTRFTRTVDVPTIVVDPIESGFYGQSGQHAVLGLVPVRRGDVHGPALVVQAAAGPVHPTVDHPEPDVRPQVHHADGQRIQFLFTPLEKKKEKCMTSLQR